MRVCADLRESGRFLDKVMTWGDNASPRPHRHPFLQLITRECAPRRAIIPGSRSPFVRLAKQFTTPRAGCGAFRAGCDKSQTTSSLSTHAQCLCLRCLRCLRCQPLEEKTARSQLSFKGTGTQARDSVNVLRPKKTPAPTIKVQREAASSALPEPERDHKRELSRVPSEE